MTDIPVPLAGHVDVRLTGSAAVPQPRSHTILLALDDPAAEADAIELAVSEDGELELAAALGELEQFVERGYAEVVRQVELALLVHDARPARGSRERLWRGLRSLVGLDPDALPPPALGDEMVGA